MKDFNTFALALIYPNLPEEIKEKVMISILSQAGFSFSLDDLKSKTSPTFTSKKAILMPTYKPTIYCPSCRKKLHEIGENEESTPEMEAKYLDEHLDTCPIFQVYEKHKKP